MSFDGLKAYRESKQNEGGSRDFLRLKDKETVKIRPLQELDGDAEFFSPKNGLAKFSKEWQNPDDYRKSCVDTTNDEGACVGQEMLNEYGWTIHKGTPNEAPGWRPKDWLYLNVLVDNGKDDPYVAILRCNATSDKAVVSNTLINFAESQDNHSITNRWWKYSRKGAGKNDTVYTLVSGDPEDLPSVESYELLDLEDAMPQVPYARQRVALGVDEWIRKHFGTQSTPSDVTENPERTVSSTVEW